MESAIKKVTLSLTVYHKKIEVCIENAIKIY